MFHQNAQHTGLSPFPGPTIPFLKWKFQTGGGVHSPPAVSHGRIYLGSYDGNLYALNGQGMLLWKYYTGYPIRTTPAIGSDGTIYLASCVKCEDFSARPVGVVYAISSGGKLKWNFTIIPLEFDGSLSSPTIGSDGTIYVSSMGFQVVALNPDGTLKWSVPTGGEIFDSPAVSPDGTVYVTIDDPSPSGTCGECLAALNPDGTVKWGALPQASFSAPAVGSDGTVYVDGYAVNPDGTVKWRNPGTFYSPSMGSDGTIYGSAEGGLYAVNPDGTNRWQFPIEKGGGHCVNNDCSIVFYTFVQESSSAIGSNGIVYFGSVVTHLLTGSSMNSTGSLYAVRTNGSLAWNFSMGSVGRSCACGQFLVVSDPTIGPDGTLYVGSSDGNLYAIA